MKTCIHGHERTPENVSKSGNCKECARERAREWYLVNTEKAKSRKKNTSAVLLGPNGFKLCSKGHEKTPENTYKDGKCKKCLCEREKVRYYTNPEVKAAYSVRWRSLNADKERNRRKEYRLANKERCDAATRKWELANPEAKRRHKHNRRSRINGVGGTLSKGLSGKLLVLQKGKCRICKANLHDNKYHIDHITPVSKGGTNTDDNIQLLCPTCNLSKGSKLPEIHAQELGMLFY